jgi:hypothetical protein
VALALDKLGPMTLLFPLLFVLGSSSQSKQTQAESRALKALLQKHRTLYWIGDTDQGCIAWSVKAERGSWQVTSAVLKGKEGRQRMTYGLYVNPTQVLLTGPEVEELDKGESHHWMCAAEFEIAEVGKTTVRFTQGVWYFDRALCEREAGSEAVTAARFIPCA